jgi:hypothetical protein
VLDFVHQRVFPPSLVYIVRAALRPFVFNVNAIGLFRSQLPARAIYGALLFDTCRYNQFVPQLMLGSALCNSTNAPDYKPIWCELDRWYIGSQYFMGLYGCKNQSDAASCGVQAHAATGELIAVTAGDTVYTRFDRTGPGGDGAAWQLTMGIKGDPVPPSVVVAHKPYMGLVAEAISWSQPAFSTAYDSFVLLYSRRHLPLAYDAFCVCWVVFALRS